MSIHVYRATGQPATRFVLDIGFDKPHRLWTRNPPHRPLWCRKCRRRRWAANLIAHAYYDGTWFTCKPGKGCKAGP